MTPRHLINYTIALSREIWDANRTSGGECICVRVPWLLSLFEGPPTVLKTYTTYAQAQRASARQSRASEYKLAPRCSQMIVGVCVEGTKHRRYAYISQYAVPCDCRDGRKMTPAERRTLRDRLTDFGIARKEVINRNCGRLADGTLVFLDFGDLSTTTKIRVRKPAGSRRRRGGVISRGVL